MELVGPKRRIVFYEKWRPKMRTNQIAAVATMIAATALMSGCRIESDKRNGNDNVKIATPFGLAMTLLTAGQEN